MRNGFGVLICLFCACLPVRAGEEAPAPVSPRVQLTEGENGKPAGTFHYSLVTGRFFEWNTDPTAVPGLFRAVTKRTKVRPRLTPDAIALDSPRIHRNPLLILTGNRVFHLSDAEVANLRRYLEHGGFLYADDCGGSDLSFRRALKRIFPDKELKELTPKHPLFRSHYQIEAVPKIIDLYRGPAKAFGLQVKGRLAVVYTYDTDIPCAWEIYPDGSYVHVVPPQKREAAQQFGVNVILHALSPHMKDGTPAPSPMTKPTLLSLPTESIRALRMEKQLPCHYITSFAQDGQSVWVGGHAVLPGEDEGLARYNLQTRQWRQYLDAEGVLAEEVNCLAVHDGLVLIGADTWKFSKGLSVLKPETREWQSYTRNDGLPHDRVVGIAIRRGAIWAACRQGLATLSPGETRFQKVDIPGGPMKDFLISVFSTDRHVWISNFEDLLIHVPETKQWISSKAHSPLVSGHAVALAASGNRVWIAPGEPQGAPVLTCDETTMTFAPFEGVPNLPAPVTALGVVPAGRVGGKHLPEELWVGTKNGTLIRSIADASQRHTPEGLRRKTLGEGPIRVIHATATDAFVASEPFGGIWHYQRATETWEHIGTRAVLPSDINFATAANGDHLFLGTLADGPWALPVKDGRLGSPSSLNIRMQHESMPYVYRRGHESIRFASIYDMVVENQRVWMATNHGLVVYDPESTPQGFIICEGPAAPIKRLAVTAGRIYCGLPDGGFWCFSARTMKPLPRRWSNDEPVQALAAQGERVWVGTERALHYLQWEQDGLRPVATLNMPARALLLDGETLWAAASAGIFSFDTTAPLAQPPSPRFAIPYIVRLVQDGSRLFAITHSALHVMERHNRNDARGAVRSYGLTPHLGEHAATDICLAGDAVIITSMGGGVAVIRKSLLVELPQ